MGAWGRESYLAIAFLFCVDASICRDLSNLLRARLPVLETGLKKNALVDRGLENGFDRGGDAFEIFVGDSGDVYATGVDDVDAVFFSKGDGLLFAEPGE